MKYSGKLPATNVNITDTHPLKEFSILIFGLFAILFVIYSLLGEAVGFAIQYISPEQEETLSLSFIDKQFTEKRDDEKSKALQKMADAMREKCVNLPYDVRVFVAQKNEVNAVALPGGTIMVFSGLLKKVRSENELAFILGHELGHYKNKDHLFGLGRGIVFIALSMAFFGADSGANDFLASFLNISEGSFSRQQESLADAFALKVLGCHYGHVSGATNFFEELVKGEGFSRFSHFLASHPDTAKRIKDIKRLTHELGLGSGNLTSLNPVFSSN